MNALIAIQCKEKELMEISMGLAFVLIIPTQIQLQAQ
jgi:hypothetical protein